MILSAYIGWDAQIFRAQLGHSGGCYKGFVPLLSGNPGGDILQELYTPMIAIAQAVNGCRARIIRRRSVLRSNSKMVQLSGLNAKIGLKA